MKKFFSQSIKTLFLALLFGATTVFAASFVGPSGTPANSNAPSPLNVSSTDQTKAGKLMITGVQTGGLYVGPTGFNGIPNAGSAHIEGGVSIGNGVTVPASGNLSVKKSIGAGTVNMASSPAGSIGASGIIAAGSDIFTALGNIYSGAGAYLGSYLPAGTTGGVAAERFCLPGANGANCVTTWPAPVNPGTLLPNGTATGQMLSWDQAATKWVVNSVIKNLLATNKVGINMPGGFAGVPTDTLDVNGDIRGRTLTGANPVLCHDAAGKIITCVVTNGGGTLMPPGTTDQTLRHNGTNWVATSTLTNSDQQVTVTTPQPLKVVHPGQTFSDPVGADLLFLKSAASVGVPARISTNSNFFELWTTNSNNKAQLEAGGLRLSTLPANQSVCTSSTGWFTSCTAGGNNTPLPIGTNYNTLRYNGTAWVANNSIKDDGHTLTVGDQTYTGQPYDAYKVSVKRGGLLVDLSGVNAAGGMGTDALTLKTNTAQNSYVSILTNAPTFNFWSSAGAPAKIESGSIHAAGNIDADSSITAGANIHADQDITADGNISAFGYVVSQGSYVFANVTATDVTQVAGDVRAQHSLISDNLRNNTFNPVCADSVGKLALCTGGMVISTDTHTTAGTYTTTVPTGAHSARVQIWGAGGGGAATAYQARSGGGGGGGGYIDTTVTVTPGQSYQLVVGNAGGGQTSSNGQPVLPIAGNGGDSSFNAIYFARGGKGAPNASTSNASGNCSPSSKSCAGDGGTVTPLGTVGNHGTAGVDGLINNPGIGGNPGSGSSYGRGGNGGANSTPNSAGNPGNAGAVIITYTN